MKDEKINVSVKMDAEMVKMIDESALKEERDRSKQIIYIIKKYYDLQEKK